MRARFTWSFLLLVALAFPALAQDRRGGPSLDRVLPQIARTVPGTFYDAEGPFLTADGRASYRIKWMTPDGRIIWFNVDARTGQVLGRGAPTQQTNQYRNDDYDNRDYGSRGQHFGDDRDDRGYGGRDWNQDRGGADRSGDRDGHDRNRGGDRSSRNQGSRGGDRDDNGGRGRDNNRGGNDRGGHDRRHGG